MARHSGRPALDLGVIVIFLAFGMIVAPVSMVSRRSASILHRRPRPKAAGSVTVGQSRCQSVGLIHWRQKAVGRVDVFRLRHEPPRNRIVEIDAAQRVVEIPGHAIARH
jgi:hypothetical protein